MNMYVLWSLIYQINISATRSVSNQMKGSYKKSYTNMIRYAEFKFNMYIHTYPPHKTPTHIVQNTSVLQPAEYNSGNNGLMCEMCRSKLKAIIRHR